MKANFNLRGDLMCNCAAIAYTDHKSCEAIVKMTSLQTTSLGKLNLRLANCALLLSQYWYNLEVRYVKEIENVLADSLSRLCIEAITLSGETLRASQLRKRLDDIRALSRIPHPQNLNRKIHGVPISQ